MKRDIKMADLYKPEEAPKFIDDMIQVSKTHDVSIFRLVWPNKGNTPTYPWHDMALNLSIMDEDCTMFGTLSIDKQLPATAAKVELKGKGMYKEISRDDLETVVADFITEFGGTFEMHVE